MLETSNVCFISTFEGEKLIPFSTDSLSFTVQTNSKDYITYPVVPVNAYTEAVLFYEKMATPQENQEPVSSCMPKLNTDMPVMYKYVYLIYGSLKLFKILRFNVDRGAKTNKCHTKQTSKLPPLPTCCGFA